MNVIHLTEEEFLNRVADYRYPQAEWRYFGNRPAIVDFYAGWCGPCRALGPVLEEIATKYGGEIYVCQPTRKTGILKKVLKDFGPVDTSKDIRVACGPVIPCGRSKDLHEAAFDWMATKLESWGLPVER